jgi:phosphoribosylglycinamide formyltransferase-1
LSRINIVCFASGRGSNVRALIRGIASKNIPADIVLVISNNSSAGVLDIAREAGITAKHISEKQFASYDEFSDAVCRALDEAHAGMIVLAGYMKKLPPAVCKKFPGKILNIHPALLPAFGGKGMFGIHVHEAVLASGASESGATVHLVDEEYDRGKILLQEKVPVLPGDTPETLAARVLELEHKILPEAVARMVKQIQDQAINSHS